MSKEKSQADKFREAARELETDDDERRFDENMEALALAGAVTCEKCGFVAWRTKEGTLNTAGIHGKCLNHQSGSVLKCEDFEQARSSQSEK